VVTDEALDQLQSEMASNIHACNHAVRDQFEREGRAAGVLTPTQDNIIDVDWLTATARREIQKLKLERDIGIMNEDPHLRHSVIVNVNNSAIAALNLNSVIQEVTATINALHNSGNDAIAQALTALARSGYQRRSIGRAAPRSSRSPSLDFHA